MDPEDEEEARAVGAVLQAVQFEYARETLKAILQLNEIQKAAHKVTFK